MSEEGRKRERVRARDREKRAREGRGGIDLIKGEKFGMKEFVSFLADGFLESLHGANGLAIICNPGDASNIIQASEPFESFCFKHFLIHALKKKINYKYTKVELTVPFLQRGTHIWRRSSRQAAR